MSGTTSDTQPPHYVIIGGGMAGSAAAETLRAGDAEARISLITMGSLPVYNRYALPRLFEGQTDWRPLLVHPPEWYDAHRLTLRRNSRVSHVDTVTNTVWLAHGEPVSYTGLLVATGGRPYLPEELADFKPLLDSFTSYETAMRLKRRLPVGGRVIMIGGDMIGLDLARHLLRLGYGVTLVPNTHSFWPHKVEAAERQRFLQALAAMGMVVQADGDGQAEIDTIAEGKPGMAARRVIFRNGQEIHGDAVMAFCGLVPAVEFMLGSGVDIERGLLVTAELQTTAPRIWAAGDVCQIWSPSDNTYRFFYGAGNVRAMGELAARNMLGAQQPFSSTQDETLRLDPEGHMHSPFWDYDEYQSALA